MLDLLLHTALPEPVVLPSVNVTYLGDNCTSYANAEMKLSFRTIRSSLLFSDILSQR